MRTLAEPLGRGGRRHRSRTGWHPRHDGRPLSGQNRHPAPDQRAAADEHSRAQSNVSRCCGPAWPRRCVDTGGGTGADRAALATMIYTVTLNPALDRELTVPALVLDEVLRATAARVDCG